MRIDGLGATSYSTGLFGSVSGTSETSADPNQQVKDGYKSSPAECQTCKERKYQDGSDENVSYKAATHIDPDSAASAVMGHEQEHVSNAYTKAAQGGGKVVSCSVSIHTAICPECGRSYVSGGTTSSVISYPKESASGRSGQTENFDIA